MEVSSHSRWSDNYDSEFECRLIDRRRSYRHENLINIAAIRVPAEESAAPSFKYEPARRNFVCIR